MIVSAQLNSLIKLRSTVKQENNDQKWIKILLLFLTSKFLDTHFSLNL